MAKKKVGGGAAVAEPPAEEKEKVQQSLDPDWKPEPPQEVQEKATAYRQAMDKKAKAATAFKTAKQNLIESMKQHGLTLVRVPVKEGFKNLRLETTEGVKLEAVKEPVEVEDDDDGDDE